MSDFQFPDGFREDITGYLDHNPGVPDCIICATLLHDLGGLLSKRPEFRPKVSGYADKFSSSVKARISGLYGHVLEARNWVDSLTFTRESAGHAGREVSLDRLQRVLDLLEAWSDDLGEG